MVVRCLQPPSWILQQYGPSVPWAVDGHPCGHLGHHFHGPWEDHWQPTPAPDFSVTSQDATTWRYRSLLRNRMSRRRSLVEGLLSGKYRPHNELLKNSWDLDSNVPYAEDVEDAVFSDCSDDDDSEPVTRVPSERLEPDTPDYQDDLSVSRSVKRLCGNLWRGALDFYAQASNNDPENDIPQDAESIPWIPSLHLTMKDKLELVKSMMLSDKHIFAVQKLLKIQFPHVGGLQDTCLSQVSFLRELVNGAPIVQIHHTRGNHWVVSYRQNGDVWVLDSVYDKVTEDLARQLRQIYDRDDNENNEGVNYRLLTVQKQSGSRDCGLFAVAFALELCLGNDVNNILFAQSEMRSHLVHCLEDGYLSQFPVYN